MSARSSGASRHRSWVRLDNAANIFLAARTELDTKVFRLSAELDEQVDPDVLQRALDRVFVQYPLFRAVLRRGFFWYYLLESDRSPVVAEDTAAPVSHLYSFDGRELLFRVLYRGRRVSLEIFHALTDGTGALWFFQDLLTEYVGLRHPDEFAAVAPPVGTAVKQEFTVDAFTHWFASGTGKVPFIDEASPAVESASTHLPDAAPPGPVGPIARHRHPRSGVVRVHGTHAPDLRTRVVELSMPVKPVLGLARAEGVSLTIYLVALFFESLRATREVSGRERTMTVSVPVNLRQFFPSESGRNFFATTRLEHTYGTDPEADTLGAVCRDLDTQFRRQLTHESLERKIRRLISFERHPVLRFFPRPLKDLVLGMVNRSDSRGITVAITNLGRVTLPTPADRHVGRLYLHVSAARPQFSAMSHGDRLTVSFTSPFVETDHHAAFVRHLTARGVTVGVEAARVTAQEIAGEEGAVPVVKRGRRAARRGLGAPAGPATKEGR
ncbi:hypothetical protein GA0111570_10442 [Raineyella antarctica]|uniref:Alcohol acetyltransferase n=1 Tax=Raineyella antarctica TaxID=1577474 RepID=A0A1G6GL62_9ACTN|nr:alcohol acetyltransferase [Raineyella antarctica]SDB82751.1 hypothetical protein GA0111570_10442 [Raineyella antarctica]